MAISPIDLGNAMTRTQDYATIKQNEDNKGFVDQSNFQSNLKKEVDNRLNQVQRKDGTEFNNKKFDAKEKGSNEYFGDGGKKKSVKENTADKERVVLKNSGHFDVHI